MNKVVVYAIVIVDNCSGADQCYIYLYIYITIPITRAVRDCPQTAQNFSGQANIMGHHMVAAKGP